jgi:predicted small secreted protein
MNIETNLNLSLTQKERKMAKNILIASLLAMFAIGVIGCEQEGPAEKAGKKIDNAVEEAGEKIEEAGEKIEESAKE